MTRKRKPPSHGDQKEGVIGFMTSNGSVQQVRCDDGSEEWLMGMCTLAGAQAGERVTLTFEKTGAYALWFPRRVVSTG